jgi:minor extracellular serine protease Vpr
VKRIYLLFTLLSVASAEPRVGRYVLILSDPPLAKQVSARKDLRSAAASDRLRSIQDKQRAISDSLIPLGAKAIGGIQTLANEVFVIAPDDQMDAMRALPGVAAVYRDVPLKPTMNTAAGLMNAPAAWNALGGADKAGLGIRIAILDTGIDLNHAAFKDTTLTAPSPAIDCTKGTGLCTTPSNKVIVARNYMKQVNYFWLWDATTNKPVLNTDPSNTRPDDYTERDHSGHGTAMAAIAGGAQVTTPADITFRGIAPKAQLGVYKIFGSPGLNEVTYASALQAALEDALLDGMDVAVVGVAEIPIWYPDDKPGICPASDAINGYCDWTTFAIRNAISKGLVVVTSAGNNGDLGTTSPLGSITTPGTIPEAITVGAITNSHIAWQTVKIGGSGVPSDLQTVNAFFGNGPKPVQPVSAQVVDVSTLGNDGYACSALPGGSLSGKIALIQRGTCVRDTKINNANAAGAVAVILYEDADHRDFIFYMGALQNTGIPAVLIGNTAGVSLKNFLKTNANATATLDPTARLVDTQEVDTVSFFSSEGPSIDGAIKPELVATGTDLYTATQAIDPAGPLYSSTGYTAVEGTSFSAAIVGGAAALVLQQHQGYTPAQVKSALVNTANTAVFELDQNSNPVAASINAVGAGKLDALAALRADVTVEPATASFGFVGQTISPMTLRLKNTGNAPVTLTLSVEPIQSDTVTQVLVSTQTLTLNPGQTDSSVSVIIRGSPSRPGSYSGDIVIRGGAVNLHVPYQYVFGDATAANLLPTQGIDWIRPVNDTHLFISFRALDRYGAPVANLSGRFTAPAGSKINVASGTATDQIGFLGTSVILGSNVGEQQFTATAGGLTATFNGRIRQRPTITKIVDAANTNNTTVAVGGYATIFGTNMSEAIQISPSTDFPVSLSGVAVSFDVPDAQISVPGRMYYVSPTQINLVVPTELRGYTKANVKVMIWDNNWNDTTSADPTTRATFEVNLADISPAFFEFDTTFAGCQCAAALDEKNGYVTKSHPVLRGQAHRAIFFLSGLGELQQQGTLSVTKFTPDVTIGGVRATVDYSGAAPGFIGLYQVNVIVPDNTPTGVQPVTLTINGAKATTSLPVQ